MASWTVLTRDVAGDSPLRAAERVEFVREKFSWIALFFAPLVLLRYRLWLVFAAYVVVMVLLAVAELRFGLEDVVASVVTIGFHALIALELPALRIRKLRWRGYEEAGAVIARDLLEAELRFFAEWQPQVALARPRAPSAGPRAATPASATRQVIGSFPEPYAP